MTRTERMKQAIEQKRAAEAKPANMQPLHIAPKADKPPKDKKKPPKPDRYATQPERFDTALQLHDRSRLPADSAFHLYWNGAEWAGSLVLADKTLFALTGRKLFRLLADIDQMYRTWKAQQPKPEEKADGTA